MPYLWPRTKAVTSEHHLPGKHICSPFSPHGFITYSLFQGRNTADGLFGMRTGTLELALSLVLNEVLKLSLRCQSSVVLSVFTHVAIL